MKPSLQNVHLMTTDPTGPNSTMGIPSSIYPSGSTEPATQYTWSQLQFTWRMVVMVLNTHIQMQSGILSTRVKYLLRHFHCNPH